MARRCARFPPADLAARRRLVGRLGGEAVLNADPITATPRMLGRLDGTLTGPRAGDPATVAMGYVDDNAAALGLGAGRRGDAAPRRPRSRSAASRTCAGARRSAGSRCSTTHLQAAVDGDGRVVSVAGRAAPRPRRRVGHAGALRRAGARRRRARRRRRPSRDRDGRADRPAPRDDLQHRRPRRARPLRRRRRRPARLAGDLQGRSAAWYDAVVDAATGADPAPGEHGRLARHANVFDNYPGAPLGGAQRTVSLDQYLTDPARGTTLERPDSRTRGATSTTTTRAGASGGGRPRRVAPGPPFHELHRRRNDGRRLRRRPQVLVGRRERGTAAGDDEPRAERGPGLLVRQPLPRPPRRARRSGSTPRPVPSTGADARRRPDRRRRERRRRRTSPTATTSTTRT